MKESFRKIVSILVIAVIVCVLTICFCRNVATEVQPVSLGSIVDGQAFYSTTTSSGFTQGYTLKVGSGIFGSVVITAATTGTLTVYDATTTINGAIYGTTTLAKFAASTAAGTYTFDSVYSKGLLVEYAAGGYATSTITWR